MAGSFTLGVILGNRDFFPDTLITEARRDLIRLFADLSIDPIWLSAEQSKLGAVESWADAQRCGELFRENRRQMDGILVCLPNFGDEKGIADAIRIEMSDLWRWNDSALRRSPPNLPLVRLLVVDSYGHADDVRSGAA